MLCAAPFADELLAGVPTLGAADIRADLALTYGAVAATVLAAPLLLGLFVESPLLLAAKRVGRRRMTAAGFCAMAAGALGAALSASAWQLALCLSFAAAGGGVALALVETTLMDAAPERRELWMTRFTIGATLGDLAAPGLLAAVAFLGFGWRGAFVAVALSTMLAALLIARHVTDGHGAAVEERLPIRVVLRRALTNGRLLLWSLGVVACDLLDEILVVVAMLFLREVRGIGPGAAALALAILPAAGMLGLVLTERMLRRMPPLRWLALNCAACVVGIAGLVAIPSVAAAIAMLGVVGFTAASMWPIATAQAYRALPQDSTTVAAVENLFAPLGVALPVAIAAAADLWGLSVAVALLAIQPMTLLVLMLALRRDTHS